MKNRNKLKITLMFLLGVVLTFLMINNTSAYSLPNKYNIDINEDYIINLLEDNNYDIDFSEYNIYASIAFKDTSSTADAYDYLEIAGILKSDYNSFISNTTDFTYTDNPMNNSYDSVYIFSKRYVTYTIHKFYFRYNIRTSTVSTNSNSTSGYTYTCNSAGGCNIFSVNVYSSLGSTAAGLSSGAKYYGASNFDFPSLTNLTNSVVNVWSFQTFPETLTYNPNVLDNNVNFKKECINNQNTYFSVLPTDIDTLNTSTDFPINNYFISPYLLENFYINFLSFSSNDISYSISDNNFTSMYYKFNTYDKVHDFSSLSSNVFNDFNILYPNLYQSLYGYTLFNTYMNYIFNTGYFTTQVYHLSNAYSSLPLCSTVGGSTVCITDNGTIHGGGGRDHDTIIESPTQNTCFYIPIDYEIKIWDINDFNDINDNINIGGIDYDITTTSYEEDYTNIMNNSSYSGFIGYFNHILNVATIPITFISSKFSRLFNGLPIDIQYLVIGVLSLGFIIGIVKFLTGGK